MQLFPGDHRGISESGSHRSFGQRRVLLVDLRLGHRRGKAVEHEADWDPGAAEPSLAVDDGRVERR